jgi:L-amino acid N-acyltransferase YncA
MLTIRMAHPGDAPAIQEIYAPYCTDTPISFENEPPSVDQIRERMAKVQAQLPWLVAEEFGSVAGYAYASLHRERAAYRWSVDAAIYVGRARHRRGLGRALYTPLFEIVRRQGYAQAFAGITLPNAASVGLHEAMGFAPVGVFRAVGYKLGAWHDVGWWQLALREDDGAPDEPAPIAKIDVSEFIER